MTKLALATAFLITLATVTHAADPASAPASTKPADITAALDAGTAIARIEVTAVDEKDNRPSDGNDVITITFKTLKSSGKIPDAIHITIAYGGRRIAPPPVPSGPLIPNPLVKGQRYWLVFNDKDPQKFPQGISAFYLEKDAPAALDAAATAKKYDK